MSKFDKTSRAAATIRGPHKKSSGSMLLGVFIGLVLGILIALGVVWYLNKARLPFQNKYEGAPPAPVTNGAQTPLPLPGKPGDKAQQRFEFYGLLEGKQPAESVSAAPEAERRAVTIAPDAAAKPSSSEVYFLQVGAFQSAADADNLKAKLALAGLEASVQEVNIPEKGTMHRVRAGPFRDPAEMNRARALLSQSGVQGAVIKQKE